LNTFGKQRKVLVRLHKLSIDFKHLVYAGIPAVVLLVIQPDSSLKSFQKGETHSQAYAIRKTGKELEQSAIRSVKPVYPAEARAALIEEWVMVEVTVDETGNVISARPVKGHSMLKDEAVEAARGWKFNPAKLKGRPAKVVGTLEFNFIQGEIDIDRDIRVYTQEVKSNPASAEAHCKLGESYKRRFRFQEAIAELKTAISINPQFALAYFSLGECYYSLGESGDLAEYREAIEAYKQAIRLKQNLVEAYYGLGWSYERLKQYDDAIQVLLQATKVRPDPDVLYRVYAGIASIYKKEGRNSEAIQAYKQVVKIDREILTINPDEPLMAAVMAYTLGRLCAEANRYEEAIEAYREVTLIKPNSNESLMAFLKMASAYRKMERDKEADELFSQLLEWANREIKVLRPNSQAAANSHYFKGLVYEEMGRYKDAIEAFKWAVDAKRDWADPHLGLARIYRRIGDERSLLKEEAIIKKLGAEAAYETEKMQESIKKHDL
jgi:TonB family protein